MIILTQGEITKKQQQIKKDSLLEINRLLNSGIDFFNTVFPQATIKTKIDNQAYGSSARDLLDFTIKKIQQWIENTLDCVIETYHLDDTPAMALSNIRLTHEINEIFLKALLRILACDKNLNDSDFLLIDEITNSMNITKKDVFNIIEQAQYEIRKDFFQSLLEYLSEEQRILCAILLLKAIRADDRVHPAEIKYFENISQLLKYDQIRLEQIEEEATDFNFESTNILNEELSVYMFEYLIEIVMCDRKYDPKESQFIHAVANSLGFNKTDQDKIIQPVAASLMVKADLFQDN